MRVGKTFEDLGDDRFVSCFVDNSRFAICSRIKMKSLESSMRSNSMSRSPRMNFEEGTSRDAKMASPGTQPAGKGALPTLNWLEEDDEFEEFDGEGPRNAP